MAQAAEPRSLFSHVVLRVVPMAAVILGLIGLQAAHMLQEADEKEVLGWLDRETTHVLHMVAHPVKTVVAEAEFLAHNDLMVNGLIDTDERSAYLMPFFHSLRLPGPEGTEVSLLDYQGRVIVSNRPTSPSSRGVDVWRRAIAAGLTKPFLSSQGFAVVAPVHYLGKPEGAILIRYRRDKLAALFDVADLPLAVALIDAEGRVVFASDAGLGTTGELAGRLDPDAWISLQRPVPGLPDLTVIAAQRTEEAFATAYKVQLILGATLLFSVLTVVGTAAITAFLSTREVGRLVRLIRGIDSVEDMSRRLDVHGPRELRDLGHSFNAMLDVLQHETTSRHYVDSILNSLAEILIVAAPDGSMRTLNPAAHRFLADIGIAKSAPVGDVFHADSFGPGADPSTFAERSGGTAAMEATYTMPNGSRATILWLKSALREPDSAIAAGTIFVGQDISERIRVEQLKSEFISTVSHELRTPLTSIAGTLGLLKGGIAGTLPQKAGELVAIGHNNCTRLITLINDLLDIQKIEGGGMEFRMQAVGLEAVIEAAVARNRAYAASRGVSFVFRNDNGAAVVMADADRIDQVMANLLSNAAKFSPVRGTVEVTLRTDDTDAVVSVADHGPGIPHAFRPRIFQRFAQADSSDTRKRGGTGLGLAIVQAIVERHGGRVWYDSEPGKGSTFYFALPLHHQQQRAESAGSA